MNKNKMICVDGNTAAAYIAYAMSEVSAIYPITPSTTMAELCEEWAADGKKNIFDRILLVSELQSEAGAAGAVHGSLAAGALSTTFTASQGLLLMIPNMYKIAGELLPTVFHVSARTLAPHAINIFGDHSDVMACRQTGFCMLASNNVQESMDLALVAHIASLKASLPFLHFFDGFRTSHEISKIEEISYDTIKELAPYDAIQNFKKRAHNPEHPKLMGSAENADTFFQNREACNNFYTEAYNIVEKTMKEIGDKIGRKYAPFEYYGPKDATQIIVSMGSSVNTIEETLDILNASGKKVGLIKVRLYRPFNSQAFCNLIPKTAKIISVLDRTKEQGSIGEPLFLDVVAAMNDCNYDLTNIKVIGGRYGLGGKEFNPNNVLSIIENMENSKPINHFTVGINDDVSHLSLPVAQQTNLLKPKKQYELKFFGLGSDGTISANKSSIKIIGGTTNKFVQGHFEYDSKKSGGLTTSHLRTSDEPILSSYVVDNADFIAIHNFSFVNKYDVLKGLKQNGSVLLNTEYSVNELGKHLPESFKKHLIDTNSKLFIIPAIRIANAIGMRGKINTIMQSCFFKISNVIDYTLAVKEMKSFATKAYGKKGEAVLQANMKAIDSAINDLVEVNLSKINQESSMSACEMKLTSKYYNNFVRRIERLEGNDLPVSAFNPDGSIPTGTSQYEKRGISDFVPKWLAEKCIQCGQCTFVCPHAAIRSSLLSTNQMQKAPQGFAAKPAIGLKNGEQFAINISPCDCTGCQNCVKTCPVKALEMVNDASQRKQDIANFKYIFNMKKEVVNPFNVNTVKGVQFEKPYFEFSGACNGCGETPYIKLITQLYGDHMVVANATGCSSIYSSSSPTCPYTFNNKGQGPSWGNSLFEDNAEFGFGMKLAYRFRQDEAFDLLTKISKCDCASSSLQTAIKDLIANKETKTSLEKAEVVKQLLSEEITNSKSNCKSTLQKALNMSDMFAKKSVWIFGGDGWAYDIGFGGLDHVIASGENVNILVMDTEVYSNTGGQSSKSTPVGAVAKLRAGGKETKKKNLALIAMTYKDVYVAQVAMGADQNQFIKAVTEAESYDGPSIIIAYAPCINHGIDMSNTQSEEKKAVACGYWNLFRFDPRKEQPLTIDSQEPTANYEEFIKGENRYAMLYKKHPELAKQFAETAEKQAKMRLQMLKSFGISIK